MSGTMTGGSYSFREKLIRATFIRKDRKFTGGGDTLILEGLRAQVRIADAWGIYQGQLDAQLFGLTRDHMADLFFSTGVPFMMTPNSLRVQIEAGTAGSLTKIWDGYIADCQADFSGQPEVPLHFTGIAAYNVAMEPAAPHSFPGRVDAATILQRIATDAGLMFENDGATGKILDNQTTSGSAYDQIAKVAGAVGVGWTVESNKLTIWNPDKGRTKTTVVFAPGAGLIGYPVVAQGNIMFRAEFTPGLRVGDKVEIASSITFANGTWPVRVFSHALDAMTPGGAWHTEIVCTPGISVG